MKCPRCKEEFTPAKRDLFNWLLAQQLDASQISFILLNYGTHLYTRCVADLKESFYSTGINPRYELKAGGKHD